MVFLCYDKLAVNDDTFEWDQEETQKGRVSQLEHEIRD